MLPQALPSRIKEWGGHRWEEAGAAAKAPAQASVDLWAPARRGAEASVQALQPDSIKLMSPLASCGALGKGLQPSELHL